MNPIYAPICTECGKPFGRCRCIELTQEAYDRALRFLNEPPAENPNLLKLLRERIADPGIVDVELSDL